MSKNAHKTTATLARQVEISRSRSLREHEFHVHAHEPPLGHYRSVEPELMLNMVRHRLRAERRAGRVLFAQDAAAAGESTDYAKPG